MSPPYRTKENRLGAALAQGEQTRIDCAAGIPDSGNGHAIGYANEKKIPCVRLFVKYTPIWPRSFMPQDQSLLHLVARMKLFPIRNLIGGQRILFCEDSIVRVTRLKENIRVLFDFGAREVHMQPARPTLIQPCGFLNFPTSRSILDLAGRKTIHELENGNDLHLDEHASPGTERNQMVVKRIQEHLKLTILKYQRLDDLIGAIGCQKKTSALTVGKVHPTFNENPIRCHRSWGVIYLLTNAIATIRLCSVK